jgi:hypothetical protein
MLPEHGSRFFAEDGAAGVLDGIQSLSQCGLRGDLGKAQGAREEFVLAERLDVVEIRLAQAQQTDRRTDDVPVLDLGPKITLDLQGIGSITDLGILQQGADQRQPRLRHQNFVCLRNDEFHGFPFLHLAGESTCAIIISISAARTSPIPHFTTKYRHGFRL